MSFSPNLESNSLSVDANAAQLGHEPTDEKKHINIKVVGAVQFLF